MFLYSEPGLYYTAYFIIPEATGRTIHHQYACVSCQQFETKGRLEKIPQPLADQLKALLGCEYAAPEVISLETGLEVESVLGEGLARLADGRYIAVNNCD